MAGQNEFVPAGELQVGDLLISHDDQRIEVTQVRSTDEVTTVYNLRVADHHTYFVGGTVWAFDVWVHNASAIYLTDSHSLYRTRSDAFAAAREMHGIPRNLNPNRVMHLVDPASAVPRSSNVISEASASSRGTWYEFLHEGKYKYIVEHSSDPDWIKRLEIDGLNALSKTGHFHIAQSPYGARIQIPNPRERYLNIGSGPSEHIGYRNAT